MYFLCEYANSVERCEECDTHSQPRQASKSCCDEYTHAEMKARHKQETQYMHAMQGTAQNPCIHGVQL